MTKMDFTKLDGLIPAVVQDEQTKNVLMVGFMNEEALEKTESSGKVTFYSRSKGRLWTKGETSGNYLHVRKIIADCDQDTVLVMARPDGPVCHTGDDTCFGQTNPPSTHFFEYLEGVVNNRKENPQQDSYTSELFKSGMNKMAQKVGEEAVELVIEALNSNNERFKNEAADLIYHLIVLVSAKDIRLEDIVQILKNRHDPS